MLHDDIYKEFEKKYPEYVPHVQEWFPNGKDSIRVRIRNGSDFIFTYHGPFDWCFMTVGYFLSQRIRKQG